MQKNGTRGYTGYYGRKSGKKGWLIAILLLILLAAAAFLFAQRYRVYRADGTSRYELPWARESGVTQIADAEQAAPELVIERETAKGG